MSDQILRSFKLPSTKLAVVHGSIQIRTVTSCATGNMKRSLSDLGEDILIYNVCTLLAIKDMRSLAETCHFFYHMLSTNAAYHLMYVKRFGSYGPFSAESHNWKELYTLHSSRLLSLYTWGSGGNGRLGYLVKDKPSNVRSLRTLGISRPCKTENFDGSIIQSITAGGYSFQILSDGQIFCTGTSTSHIAHQSPPGPLEKDSLASPDPKLMSPQLVPSCKRESKFVLKLTTPHNKEIVSISSGRQHFVALDDDGRLLTWDTGMECWDIGVYLTFPFAFGRISRISAGWNSTACYFVNIGLVVVHSRENSIFSGQSEDWPTAEAIFSIVPNLQSVIDFVALENCIVFIDRSGSLKRYDFPDEGASCGNIESLQSFDEWLIQRSMKVNSNVSFTKIVGCFKTFVVFTDDGLILIGKKQQHLFSMEVPRKLQNESIIDIVVGDYHYLAITKNGDLLSWGLELQSNGCLGLGSETDTGVMQEEGTSLRVVDPTVVSKQNTNGQWLRIAAAGWHSCAVYVGKSPMTSSAALIDCSRDPI